MRELQKQQCPFTLSLVGQQFSRRPEAFERIYQEFKTELLHFGYLESKADYIQILQKADCSLSTAHHDFQGLAMMDAIASGCVPFAPVDLPTPNTSLRNLYHQRYTRTRRCESSNHLLDMRKTQTMESSGRIHPF